MVDSANAHSENVSNVIVIHRKTDPANDSCSGQKKGTIMKCPSCRNRQNIEIGLHADGFSQDVRECSACGAIWTYSGKILKMIVTPAELKHQSGPVFSEFSCPTCKTFLCIETSFDALQFHEKFYECTNCGTVCSSSHAQLEVISDSQERSFLSTTSSLVESGDYAFI